MDALTDEQVPEQAGPAGQPGRSAGAPRRVLLLACGCRAPHYARVHRSFWMRLLPLLRLYQCVHCGAKVLRTRVGNRPSYPTS